MIVVAVGNMWKALLLCHSAVPCTKLSIGYFWACSQLYLWHQGHTGVNISDLSAGFIGILPRGLTVFAGGGEGPGP